MLGACEEPVEIEPIAALVGELTLRFAVCYRPDEFQAVIDAFAGGAIDPAALVGPPWASTGTAQRRREYVLKDEHGARSGGCRAHGAGCRVRGHSRRGGRADGTGLGVGPGIAARPAPHDAAAPRSGVPRLWRRPAHVRPAPRGVAGLARWLAREQEVRKGDRVAIGARNYPEWIVAFWATQALGAITVPLNAWWTSSELRFALEDSGTKVAVLDGERYERLVDDLAGLDLPSIVVRHDGDVGARHARWADVARDFDRTSDLPEVTIEPEDDATIIYTSGTTGRPKGAVNSHRNHITTFLNTAFSGALQRLTAAPVPRPGAAPRPCSLMTYPFFHVGGIDTIYISTGLRHEDGAPVPVGRRGGARADPAGEGDQPGGGAQAPARAARLAAAGSVRRVHAHGAQLRRSARTAGPRRPHRSQGRDARQRLRAHRDHRRGHDQRRVRLRRPGD